MSRNYKIKKINFDLTFKECDSICIVLPPTEKILRRTLKLILGATRGGTVRVRILQIIASDPKNINQLSEFLKMDYKTIQHHIRVLEKAGLIKSSGKSYSNSYALSDMLKAYNSVLEELKHMGKTR